MRITVLAAGSRGDIQPYLALAVGLQRAGHAVRLATNSNFEAFVTQYGLEFHPLRVDSYAFLQQGPGRAWLESRSLVGLIRNTFRAVRPTLRQIIHDADAACEGAEAILYHTYTMPYGYLYGRQRGLPCLPASMYPLATRAHPALQTDFPVPLGGPLNALSHFISDTIVWQLFRPAARAFWRGKARLPWRHPTGYLRRAGQPIVCGYSPAVLPRPADYPANVHITGYWFLDPPPGWTAEPDLRAFLAAGPPPVYVGFGSMGDPARARETTAIVLAALAATGQRGLLASGWSDLGRGQEPPDNIFVLRSAPHKWLLPQMAAVIHHGGVGTTGAGLYAGVPNVVVPHFGDQPFWGRLVARLGAGPEPIPRRELTAERLAAGIDAAAHDKELRQRAATLGGRLQQEDGVAHVVANLPAYLG